MVSIFKERSDLQIGQARMSFNSFFIYILIIFNNSDNKNIIIVIGKINLDCSTNLKILLYILDFLK